MKTKVGFEACGKEVNYYGLGHRRSILIAGAIKGQTIKGTL